ncbi:hypothetical protein ACJRO7_002050 [Eucalyptus globulus]|uniref:Uncharacterized protein n=1 Tax=Eucalyptus globulus TaxID=34317 RepID=A0ABD3LWU4_EUCGL
MSQVQPRRDEAGACRAEEGGAISDNPAILKQAAGKCNHDKLCDIATEEMQLRDDLKDNLASLSVAAAEENKCKRS